jgi:hypothetical protein
MRAPCGVPDICVSRYRMPSAVCRTCGNAARGGCHIHIGLDAKGMFAAQAAKNRGKLRVPGLR